MVDNTELLERLRLGEEAAEEKIIEANMGLVYSVVNRMKNTRCETEDLIQIGSIGLIKAVKKFDFSYDVKFSTYAVPMIIGEIKRFLRDDGMIKISRGIKELAIKGKKTEERLNKELKRAPTIKEVATELNVDEMTLLEAYEAMVMPASLQAGINDDGNGKDGLRLDEVIAGEDTEEKIVDSVFIKEAMKQLTDRECRIIKERYFKGRTQSEIAEEIGVSQVQISRIEKKALLKMRGFRE